MSNLLPGIAPYVPPSLIRAVLAEPAFSEEPAAERFPAAVLFVDISGFTPLTEALASKGMEGPEELNRLLNSYFSRMIACARAEGGGVVKFSGDAMTVVFEALEEPLTHATRRAQQAAEAMQAAMVDFADLETSVGTVTLGMKICIGVGELLAMQVGGVLGRWEYVIAGEPLRQVAVTAAHAERGDILLSPQATDVIHPHPLPPHPLRPPDWAAVAEPATVEASLRRFVPGPAWGWLTEGLSPWLPVLRPLTVLFAAVEGLRYEQPDVAQRLHRLLRSTQDTLYRYESTLRQLVVDDKGTVIMALFGAPPFAHEDDPQRAALCALDLLHQGSAVHHLDLSIGLATGHVFSGPVGGETRYEYTAMGDTVNLAARLMGKAEAGTALCDFDTYRQARETVACETLTPIHLKGKAGLVRIYQPTGRQVAASRVEDGTHAPIVGRQDELARLESALDAVSEGHSRVLIIEGEAGIGKSRLVAELTQMTQDRGLIWLMGSGQSIERQTPYRAWREILAFYFGLEEGSAVEANRARVLSVMRDIAPEQTYRFPLLNDVLNLGIPESGLTASLDPQLRQQSLVALLLTLLRAWAEERPLVLVLEDAHWLDSLSWVLTVDIARAFAAADAPLLLVLVARPLEEGAVGTSYFAQLRALESVEALRLGTLAADALAQLIAHQLDLPPDDLPASVVDLVHRRAEGNPFFAEELIFALREQGVITLQPVSYNRVYCMINGDLAEAAQTLPDTLQGLILARIDRLPPERQLVLKTAAVIGRAFTYAPLSYVLQEQTFIVEPVLKPHLDALAALELTPMQTPEPELTYIFKHIITQEVAYETLLFSQRRALHRTVAEWYERSYDDLSPYLPLLVHHYHQAERPEKERCYARLAGEQAAGQFANAEAVRYLTRALELTPAQALAERYALLLAREQVYNLLGEAEAQKLDIEALEQLAEAAEAAPWRAEVALRRAHYAEVCGDYPATIAAAQTAIAVGETTQDARCAAAGYLQWGRALWLQGDPEGAQQQLERALALAREADLGQVEADCLRSLGVIAYYQGDHHRGTACFEQTLTIFQRIGDRRGEAGALNNLGVVFFNRGDYGKARAYYEQSLVILRVIGYRLGEGRTVGNLGIIAHNLGDSDEAIACYEEALDIYLEVGYRQGISTLLSYLGLLFHHLDDHENAQEYCRQALYLAEELNDSLSQGFALTNLGHALAGAGAFEEAAEAYRRARDLRRESGQHNVAVESVAGLAEVRLAQGRIEAALPHAEEIARYLETKRLDGAIEPFRVYWACYRTLRAVGDPRADAILDQAHALLQARAESITDEALRRSFLESNPLHQKILEEKALRR